MEAGLITIYHTDVQEKYDLKESVPYATTSQKQQWTPKIC